MTRVADWDLFNGQFYIVMAGVDGRYYHYYNQVLVTDAMATASSVRTFGSKMYGVDGRLLRFSAINDPTHWTPPSGTTNDGSGYIDLSAQDADSTNLIGLEVYLGNMAIFSSLSTQIWKLDPDPSLNQFVQLLRSTGLLASQGLVQFGQDVLYVSSHGVRSLKVQNVSLTAGTTDIGTPIDEIFRAADHPEWRGLVRWRAHPDPAAQRSGVGGAARSDLRPVDFPGAGDHRLERVRRAVQFRRRLRRRPMGADPWRRQQSVHLRQRRRGGL